MLGLSLFSMFCLLYAFIVISALKKVSYAYILLGLFIVIQAWFSIQWSYFLAFEKSIMGEFNGDFLGLFLANLSLFLPLAFLYVSKRTIDIKRFFALIAILLVSCTLSVFMHAVISNPCKTCAFDPGNENILLNLSFQVLLDVSLILGFLFILYDEDYKKAKNQRNLRVIGIIFSLFYVNDILILLSRITAKYEFYSMASAMWIEVSIYFIFSLGIAYMGWLIHKRGNEVSIAKPAKHFIDFEILSSDWSEIKNNCRGSDLRPIVEEIEELNFLTKTEKLYMFLNHFDEIPTKKLSEILCVSPRTVETNRYRLRKKLDKNGFV